MNSRLSFSRKKCRLQGFIPKYRILPESVFSQPAIKEGATGTWSAKPNKLKNALFWEDPEQVKPR
jgi:hypothetical protein